MTHHRGNEPCVVPVFALDAILPRELPPHRENAALVAISGTHRASSRLPDRHRQAAYLGRSPTLAEWQRPNTRTKFAAQDRARARRCGALLRLLRPSNG